MTGRSADAPALGRAEPGLATIATRLTYPRLLALVALAGAVLRLGFLARQPLGFDEDLTAAAARLSLADMLTVVSRDSGPPLQYLLVWSLERVLPDPFGLRLVSALAGIAAVLVAAALGRRIGGDAAGIGAALVVAFLPAAVVAAQTGRPYALATALSGAAFLALWRALETPTAVRWLVYWLLGVAAVWTSYFAAFALAGCCAAALVVRPPAVAGRVDRANVRVLATAAVVTALAGLSLVPWLVFAAAQFSHVGQPFWVQPLGPRMLAGTLGQLLAGPQAPSYVPLALPLLVLQCVAVAAGLVAFGALVVRRPAPPEFDIPAAGTRTSVGRASKSRVPDGRTSDGRISDGRTYDGRRAIAVCAIAGSAGIVVLGAISVCRPLLDARYAGVGLIPLLALAGLGIARLPRNIAAAVLAFLLVPSLALSAALTQRETALLVPALEARAAAHDIVAAEPDEFVVLLAEAGPELRPRLHVLSRDAVPWYFGTAVYPAGTVIPAISEDVVVNGGRVLYVGAPGQTPSVALPGYVAIDSTCVVGACLTVYAPAHAAS